MGLGLALLRLIVGGLFMGHGLQKLAGWFGGGGLKRTGEAFESMDLSPGVGHAAAAGAAETGGGALIAAGLATPLGATALSGSMITAIRKVHAPKGPWAANGGYEYNLVLLAIVFALADIGPGPLSLDEALGRRRAGLGWALAQLAAGAAGSIAAVEIGSRRAAAARASEGPGGAAASEEAGASAQARPHEGELANSA
jgi:putative oxidoreductase